VSVLSFAAGLLVAAKCASYVSARENPHQRPAPADGIYSVRIHVLPVAHILGASRRHDALLDADGRERLGGRFVWSLSSRAFRTRRVRRSRTVCRRTSQPPLQSSNGMTMAGFAQSRNLRRSVAYCDD
jgi:hypothetical protein